MVITYYGIESFKVQFGDTVLGFNPVSKEGANGAIKPVRFGADIAFISLRDPAFSGVENLAYKEKTPFVVFGPGEYESKEVFIKGYPSETTFDSTGGEKKKRINTIFSAKLEGMHLVFLGALENTAVSPETLGDLGEVDILFVPIGGEGVLAPNEAYKLAVKLGAKVVVPMHYEGVKAGKDVLATFLKETGAEKTDRQEKLTIKPKDLAGKENEVIVLKHPSESK